MNIETIKNIYYLGQSFPLNGCADNTAIFINKNISIEYDVKTQVYQLSGRNYIFKTKIFNQMKLSIKNRL